MGYDGPGMWGFGWFGHLVGTIIGGLLTLFAVLVIAGLVFLLVRFLIVATRAAQLYVDRHAPAAPTSPAASAAATPTTTTKAAPAPATKPTPAAATKPPAKPRTPKTPPAS
jgi:predicted lipid-binding transport protein (Tim44 family)